MALPSFIARGAAILIAPGGRVKEIERDGAKPLCRAGLGIIHSQVFHDASQ
jgi:hypothetical protein